MRQLKVGDKVRVAGIVADGDNTSNLLLHNEEDYEQYEVEKHTVYTISVIEIGSRFNSYRLEGNSYAWFYKELQLVTDINRGGKLI